MAVDLAALRSRIEMDLAGRVAAPFTYRDRKVVETVSSGIREIDCLTGGLPRGSLTEVYGEAGSGRMSLLVSALASRTSESETCALVDGRDAFDPYSAKASGVKLDRLLWVRCKNLDQSLRATDLLLQGGGFGLIAVDLSGLAPETVRRVPLNAWFRFRRGVEDTPAILLVFEQESNAKTCASLVLKLIRECARWSVTTDTSNADFLKHPNACLLNETESSAELIRSRIQPADGYLHGPVATADGRIAMLKNKSIRDAASGIPLILRIKADTR
jgi:recombination protein RecA